MKKNVDCAKLNAAMDAWPGAWKGMDGDVATGRKIVDGMRRFVVALIANGLSRSTINRHMNNLWLLGGEIVSRTHHDVELKRKPGQNLLQAFVDAEGGPLCRHNNTEAEQRAFDSTCRKLHQFLALKCE
jgi:hypothetical protein